jgi:group I intron endonuclease
MVKIYLVENCYNDYNKVYIGKTKTTRKSSHKKTFGSNIIYTYIDEIDSFDKNDWKPLESYWIEQFKQWGFNVQNKNKGGGGVQNHSKETKVKMKKPRKGSGRKSGFKLTQEEINIRKKPRKKQSLSTIKKRTNKTIGKKRTPETKLLMSQSKLGKPSNNSKSINQYDLEGNLIKTWNTAKEAALHYNIRRHGIITCALGGTKTYKKYIWKH